MLKIRMLKAGNGDCISITTESEFILIDGGTAQSFEDWKEHIIDKTKVINTLIVTHIDNDHVNGIIKLLQHEKCPEILNILFNGAEQFFGKPHEDRATSYLTDRKLQALACELTTPEENIRIGYSEGTSLSYTINTRGLKCNEVVSGEAIYREKLPQFNIGLIKFTIIGPQKSSLDALIESWKDQLNSKLIKPKIINKTYYEAFDLYASSLTPSPTDYPISNITSRTIKSLASEPFVEDTSPTNMSSLSLLIEDGDKRILCLGDCYPSTVISWLDDNNIQKLKVDAVKVSHHGSRSSTSMELLDRLDCSIYMISTNGKSHGHPNLETLARIAETNKSKTTRIITNYRLENIPQWFFKEIQDKYSNVTIEINDREIEL
ncbi:ComEC/Rec2 family competence protein [Pseudomonas sp. NPDC078863]|jgi:beta-lactamase superfamily II metal-dependent hydrolase|uniref:ComEC/Rec2 family competence protein n=1 Tax=unclassified Pseudomonas TaxID=196821 RepID=UPI0037C6661C